MGITVALSPRVTGGRNETIYVKHCTLCLAPSNCGHVVILCTRHPHMRVQVLSASPVS